MMQGQQNHTNTKSKKVVDQDDDDWKCTNCGCPAKHTPLKRTGRDGKKSICNACYIRDRTQQERAERGSARPVLSSTMSMTTASMLSNTPQTAFYSLPYWNTLAATNLQMNMNMLKMGQLGVDNQQLYPHNAFGLSQDSVSAAIQAYQAATASGQIPTVDYNSNLNMLGTVGLGSLGLAAAAAAQTTANAATTDIQQQELEQQQQELEQQQQELEQQEQELKKQQEELEKQQKEIEQHQKEIDGMTENHLEQIEGIAESNNEQQSQQEQVQVQEQEQQQELEVQKTILESAEVYQQRYEELKNKKIKEENEKREEKKTKLLKEENKETKPEIKKEIEENKIENKNKRKQSDDNSEEENQKKEGDEKIENDIKRLKN